MTVPRDAGLGRGTMDKNAWCMGHSAERRHCVIGSIKSDDLPSAAICVLFTQVESDDSKHNYFFIYALGVWIINEKGKSFNSRRSLSPVIRISAPAS